MYFSDSGREGLIETLDKLLLAKELQKRGQYYPDKVKYWNGEGSSGLGKIEFLAETLELSLNARVDFDPDQTPKDDKYSEIYVMKVFCPELDEFKKQFYANSSPVAMREQLEALVKKHLEEVTSNDCTEANMKVSLGEIPNHLNVEFAFVEYCQTHEYFLSFLNFHDDLKILLKNMKQKKGRRTA